MKPSLQKIYSGLISHISFIKEEEVLSHLIMSFVLFCISLGLFYIAQLYTDTYTGYVVPDILLDNIPLMEMGFIFFQGAFLFVLFVVLVLLYLPRYIPFTLEASSLFIFTRSVFINMTHLSAPNTEYYKYITHENHTREVLFTITSGNDLFFSGHAGFPFLLALIFWKKKYLRYTFLICSAIGSVAVIVGHLHYTIDVASSFFIAYGIFEISKQFFNKEKVLAGIV